jgi:hypothetical protein
MGIAMGKMTAGAVQVFTVVATAMLCVSCGQSMDSMGGPETGTVTGLVCSDLPVLKAVLEVPETERILVKDGKCLRINGNAKVAFIRTVMMPGDGKYSQFEYQQGDKTYKLWISTDKVGS